MRVIAFIKEKAVESNGAQTVAVSGPPTAGGVPHKSRTRELLQLARASYCKVPFLKEESLRLS